MHAFEIPYTFSIPAALVGDKVTDTDKAMGQMASAYWVSFGKTGDPNGGKLVKWPKFDAAARAYLDFTDAGPVAKEGLRRQACDVFMENQKRQGL